MPNSSVNSELFVAITNCSNKNATLCYGEGYGTLEIVVRNYDHYYSDCFPISDGVWYNIGTVYYNSTGIRLFK